MPQPSQPILAVKSRAGAVIGRTGGGLPPGSIRLAAWTSGGGFAAVTEDQAAAREVVGSHFDGDFVTHRGADAVLAHLAGGVDEHDAVSFDPHAKLSAGEDFLDDAFHLDRFFFSHALLLLPRGRVVYPEIRAPTWPPVYQRVQRRGQALQCSFTAPGALSL